MLDKIREILEEKLDIDPTTVNEDSNFRDDLAIDSLDLFEMVTYLEDEYGIELPAEVLETIQTPGDLMEYLTSIGIEG